MIKLLPTFVSLCCCLGLIAAEADFAGNIANLINPAKLAALAERGANSRVQKCVYWLQTARDAKQQPSKVVDSAVARAGYTNQLAAKLTKEALLRNLDIADKLGCLDADGMSEMRRGNPAAVAQ